MRFDAMRLVTAPQSVISKGSSLQRFFLLLICGSILVDRIGTGQFMGNSSLIHSPWWNSKWSLLKIWERRIFFFFSFHPSPAAVSELIDDKKNGIPKIWNESRAHAGRQGWGGTGKKGGFILISDVFGWLGLWGSGHYVFRFGTLCTFVFSLYVFVFVLWLEMGKRFVIAS